MLQHVTKEVMNAILLGGGASDETDFVCHEQIDDNIGHFYAIRFDSDIDCLEIMDEALGVVAMTSSNEEPSNVHSCQPYFFVLFVVEAEADFFSSG